MRYRPAVPTTCITALVGFILIAFPSTSLAFVTTIDSTDVPHPLVADGTTVTSTLTAPAGSVADVNVTLDDIEMICTLILTIQLTSPAGTTATLLVDGLFNAGILAGQPCQLFGGDGADFVDTVVDDDSVTNLAAGSPPYTGTWNVDHAGTGVNMPLTAFDGEDAGGVWTLAITPVNVPAPSGSLNAWGLVLDLTTCENGSCDNGLFCDGSETCDPGLGCQAGTPPNLDDGVGCTIDVCDEVLDLVTHTPDDALCSDGQFCNGAETCQTGFCTGGAPPCDDGDTCTADSCDEALDRCQNVGPPLPDEVRGLTVSPLGLTPAVLLEWEVAVGADVYNLYRSTTGTLPGLNCFQAGLLGPDSMDDGLVPAIGEAHLYLPAGANCAGEGSLGSGNPPEVRQAGISCP